MIVLVNRRAEESHHLIADQLVESAVEMKYGVGRERVEAVEPLGHLNRTEPLRERRKTANVHEHDRDDPRLPTRGSQLVSESTEARVLARRANLKKAKRNGEYSQEGDETFFAALSRRQPAVYRAGDPDRAEALPDGDEELFQHLQS